jgi:hypothetical protein
MVLSKIGNKRVIHNQGREMVCNMTKQVLSGIKIPVKCVSSRVLAATGLSKRTLQRIKNETTLKKERQFLAQYRGSHDRGSCR